MKRLSGEYVIPYAIPYAIPYVIPCVIARRSRSYLNAGKRRDRHVSLAMIVWGAGEHA